MSRDIDPDPIPKPSEDVQAVAAEISFENMTARQIAALHATEVFPDAASAIALVRVLAARLADLEERVASAPSYGPDE